MAIGKNAIKNVGFFFSRNNMIFLKQCWMKCTIIHTTQVFKMT